MAQLTWCHLSVEIYIDQSNMVFTRTNKCMWLIVNTRYDKRTENNLCLSWISMRGGAINHFASGQLVNLEEKEQASLYYQTIFIYMPLEYSIHCQKDRIYIFTHFTELVMIICTAHRYIHIWRWVKAWSHNSRLPKTLEKKTLVC